MVLIQILDLEILVCINVHLRDSLHDFINTKEFI